MADLLTASAPADLYAAAPNARMRAACEAIVKAGIDATYSKNPEIKFIRYCVYDFGQMFVSVSVGVVGDEGTALSLCRANGSFVVGKRGKIKALNTPRDGSKKTDLARAPLIFGWRH